MKSFGMMALAVMALLVTGGMVTAYGFRNGAIDDALENGDYNGWKTGMEERFDEMTSEEAFEQAEQRYQRGKQMNEERKAHWNEERKAHREAMDAALTARDYEAYLAAVEDGLGWRHETLTEEDFYTLADLHEARQAGDEETVSALEEELGFEHGPRGPGDMDGGELDGGFGGHGGFGMGGFGDGGCMR